MDIFNEIGNLQIQIDKLKPLSKEQLNELKKYYKIGLTYSSNALEGNLLTESETKIVIEDGLTVNGKPLKDHFEANGHAKAYDFLYELIKKNYLQEQYLKQLHKLFYQSIDAQNAGKYRSIKVFISGSKYSLPKPDKISELMNKFIKYFNKKQDIHPVKLAALVHKKFVLIHPFIDGNGRIARLLMNLVLLKNNFPVTIIPPILRLEYIQLIEKTHTNDKLFIEFIAERVKNAQLEYINLLK